MNRINFIGSSKPSFSTLVLPGKERNPIEKHYLNWHLKRLFSGDLHSDLSQKEITAPLPRQDHVQTAARMIDSSKNPLMLVSSQAMLSTKAVPGLRDAILKLSIPTYLSGTARGLSTPRKVVRAPVLY